jgi:hypothetical protein
MRKIVAYRKRARPVPSSARAGPSDRTTLDRREIAICSRSFVHPAGTPRAGGDGRTGARDGCDGPGRARAHHRRQNRERQVGHCLEIQPGRSANVSYRVPLQRRMLDGRDRAEQKPSLGSAEPGRSSVLAAARSSTPPEPSPPIWRFPWSIALRSPRATSPVAPSRLSTPRKGFSRNTGSSQ